MASCALRDPSLPRGSTPLWIIFPEGRKTFKFTVNANDTVRYVKGEIHATEGILPQHQCLIYPISGSCCVMNDARTIGSYPIAGSCISEYNTVNLVRLRTIFVNILSGDQLEFDVSVGATTISEVKDTIEKTTKIPVALQQLMFAGEILEDCEWLADLGIEDGSNLDLVVSSTRKAKGEV